MSACFLRTQPSMSPSVICCDRQQVAEELPVVHFGRSGRDLVGNLPAEGRKRPLPGHDMMVLGVGDHPVKIQ